MESNPRVFGSGWEMLLDVIRRALGIEYYLILEVGPFVLCGEVNI